MVLGIIRINPQKARDIGMDKLLMKPHVGKDLADVVRRVLDEKDPAS